MRAEIKIAYATLCSFFLSCSGAQAAEIIGYDIQHASYYTFDNGAINAGGWRSYYSGTLTPDGTDWYENMGNLTGGRGTLNDGIVGQTDAAQFFVTSRGPGANFATDTPIITLYLDGFYNVSFVDLLGTISQDVITGNITGALVTVGDQSAYIEAEGWGLPAVYGDDGRLIISQSNDRLNLTPTLTAVSADRITLSQLHTTGSNYMFMGISEINVAGDLVASVPEPSSWAMMLIGFGAIGFTLRRRRPDALIAF